MNSAPGGKRRVATRGAVGLVATALLGTAILITAGLAAAVPVITASPTTGLLDRHRVDVTGSGHPADTVVKGAQCVAGTDPEVCDEFEYFPPPVLPDDAFLTETDGSGAFRADLRALRVIEDSGVTYDCTVVSCVLRVVVLGGVVQRFPLSFAPTGTYQWPQASLSVAPLTGLYDGDSIGVTGTGFDVRSRLALDGFPGRGSPAAALEICRDVPAPDPASDCQGGFALDDQGRVTRALVAPVDEDGEVEAAIPMDRVIDLPTGAHDCRADGCTVALEQRGNPRSNRVAISYAPAYSPYPTADAFVTDTFLGIARRSPSSSERALFVAALDDWTISGADVIDRMIDDEPGAQAVAEAVWLYQGFLARKPDTAGLSYWAQRLLSGQSPDQVARAFAATSEFRTAYAGMTNRQIAGRSYLRILNRAASASELDYWTGRLDAGLPLWKFVFFISRSSEFRSRVLRQNRVESSVVVFGLLDRALTPYEWVISPRIEAVLRSEELAGHVNP